MSETRNSGKCLGCPPGAFLALSRDNLSTCEPCSPYCKSCNSKVCMSCIHGYFIDAESDGHLCVKCTIQNCKFCLNNNVCNSCENGFY